MNLIKSRSVFWVIYTTILLAFLYSGLVLVDFLIPRITLNSPIEASLDNKKYVQDSEQQKKELLEQGFVKVIN